MRKFDLLAGGAALLLLSVSVTLYIVNHPLRPKDEDQLHVGLSAAPERVLSPSQLLSRAPEGSTGAPTKDQRTSSSASVRRQPPKHISYPPWQTNDTIRLVDSQPLTDPGDYIAPLWSPIGLDVAFTHSDLGGIYLAGLVKGPVRTLTEAAKAGSDYTWNPDGMSLRIGEPDGMVAELMITGERYPAALQPRKVFERDNVIYLQPEDGDPVRLSGQEDRFTSPRLSNDGTKVVYVGRETGIYVAALDSSLVLAVGPGANPSWLPDSSAIVYDLPSSDGMTVIDGDIWYASADGKERTNLTQTPGVIESHPAVSPDGQKIAFSCQGAIHVGKFVRPVKD